MFTAQFDHGWDLLREQILGCQLELGVALKGTTLTPRPPQVPPWASMAPNGKKLAARLMEGLCGVADAG